jgi:hypothetical protein
MSDRQLDNLSADRVEETAVASAETGRDPRMLAAMRRRQIQRKAERAGANPNVKIPEAGGAPLPAELAANMGQKLGADFSDVKVHTGGESAHAAKQLGAKAFTVDKEVHFGGGQFDPGSKSGQHLLAHELAHVAQGKAGTVQQKKQVSQPHDPAEVEADQAADKVVAGEDASVGAAPGARVHLNKDGDAAPAEKSGGDKGAPDDKAGATPGAEEKAEEKPGEEGGGDKEAAKPKASDMNTLTGLVESMTPESVALWSASPETCLQILKGPFESNWFKAKDCLLMGNWPDGVETKPDHATAMKLMDGLTAMRSIECEKVQKRAEKEIQAEVQKESAKAQAVDDPMGAEGVQGKLADEGKVNNDKSAGADGKEKPGKQVEFKAPVGNQKRTSDIDTATGGMNTELAVALFNRLFKEMLEVPYESGTMFDYNVYAMDWIHNLKFDKGKAPGKDGVEKDVTKSITPGTEHELPGEEDKKERNLTLEKASILHIRRFMNQKEWDVYCEGRIEKAEPDERPQLETLLDEVDTQHDLFLFQISEKSTEIQAQMDKALEGHESAWGEHSQHFEDEAVKTSASNRIYEERLREVKSLRVQYQILAGKPESEKTADDRQQLATLAKEVTRVLSEALFFANEVYASEGATIHVVLGMQGANKKSEEQKDTGVKVEVPLTPEQYMQSFNENVGDVLKDLGHFKDNPSFAVFRAGKYMDRACQAAGKLTPEAATHPAFPKLAAIAAQSVTTKEAKGDDPQACIEDFKDWDAGKMEALRGEVIQFGADIPSQAQAAQAKSKAVEGGEAAPPTVDGPGTEAPKGAADAATSNPLIGTAKEATSKAEGILVDLEQLAEAGKGEKPPTS